MNFNTMLKALDAVVAIREMAKRYKTPAAPRPADTGIQSAPAAGPGSQLEATLGHVVVAALKEAFDRDHTRTELERGRIEEENRRAAEALRLEVRRQAIDREIGRLRLMAGTAMVGWIASIAMLATRLASSSTQARVAIAAGWLLLLGAIGAAFTAQGRINADSDSSGSATTALWLLIIGLAATTLSLLF